MKAFSFPSGPNSISKEELELAFSKFEKVEIPGSVFRLECNFDEMKSPLLVNELVLDEGICEITMLVHLSKEQRNSWNVQSWMLKSMS